MFYLYETEKYKEFQRQEDIQHAQRDRLLLELSPRRLGRISGSTYPKSKGGGNLIARNVLTGLFVLASLALAALTMVR